MNKTENKRVDSFLARMKERGHVQHLTEWSRRSFVLILFLVVFVADAKLDAKDLLDPSEITGGLIVCLDCDDPSVLVDLAEKGSFLVHGLNSSQKNVEKSREYVKLKKQ